MRSIFGENYTYLEALDFVFNVRLNVFKNTKRSKSGERLLLF